MLEWSAERCRKLPPIRITTAAAARSSSSMTSSGMAEEVSVCLRANNYTVNTSRNSSLRESSKDERILGAEKIQNAEVELKELRARGRLHTDKKRIRLNDGRPAAVTKDGDEFDAGEVDQLGAARLVRQLVVPPPAQLPEPVHEALPAPHAPSHCQCLPSFPSRSPKPFPPPPSKSLQAAVAPSRPPQAWGGRTDLGLHLELLKEGTPLIPPYPQLHQLRHRRELPPGPGRGGRI